jgi:hypothetical protein
MWAHKVVLQSKYKGYCIKALISHQQVISFDLLYKQLNKLQSKLEQIIPRTYKPKFSSSNDGLIILIEIEKAHEAGKIIHELEDDIKKAISKL